MIDTGSQISLITLDFVQKLNIPIRAYNGPIALTADKTPLRVLGEVSADLIIRDEKTALLVQANLQVVRYLPMKYKVLIGQDILTDAEILVDCAMKDIFIKKKDPIAQPQLSSTGDTSSNSGTSENSIASEHSEVTEEFDISSFPTDESSSSCSRVDDEESLSDSCYTESSVASEVIAATVNELDLDIEDGTPEQTRNDFNTLVKKYRHVFAVTPQELGRSDAYVHKINTGDHPPISQAPYRQSMQKREITREQVDELLRDGIIVDSHSPWSSPVVLVSKKTGDWRMCVDYRKLNAITVKDSYPLPDINTSLDYLQGAEYFSLLDLRSGYHQVKMNKRDQPKTAFKTTFGMYEYKTMPFGLCNAPATF